MGATLRRSVSVWGDVDYHELGDVVLAVPIVGLIDQAQSLEQGLRRVARILEASEGEASC